jgi:hypothetical protein
MSGDANESAVPIERLVEAGSNTNEPIATCPIVRLIIVFHDLIFILKYNYI